MKKLLCLLVLLLLSPPSQAAMNWMLYRPDKQSLTYGLIAWWPMNDGAGTTVRDASGYGNTGTFAGSPSWATASFGFPYGVFFNGSSGIDCGASTVCQPTSAGTVCAWAYWTNAGTYAVAVGDATTATGKNGYILYQYAGHVRIAGDVGSASSSQYVDPTIADLPLNTWIFEVMEWSGSQFFLWTNGVVATLVSQTVSPINNVNHTMIGQDPGASGSYFFRGAIASPRIYNRVLSTNEIQQLYYQFD
jgi:hypothetical protein